MAKVMVHLTMTPRLTSTSQMNLLVLGGPLDFMEMTILLNHLHLQEFSRNLPGAAAPRRKTGRAGAASYTDQARCSVGSDLHHREFDKTSW